MIIGRSPGKKELVFTAITLGHDPRVSGNMGIVILAEYIAVTREQGVGIGGRLLKHGRSRDCVQCTLISE